MKKSASNTSMHETHSLKAWKEDGAFSGKCVRRSDRNSAVNGKTPTMYFHKIRVAHRNHWCKPTTSRRILYFWSHPTCGLKTSRSMKGAEKMRWVLKAAHTLKWGDMRSKWRSAYIKSQIHWRNLSPPKNSKNTTIILVNYYCFDRRWCNSSGDVLQMGCLLMGTVFTVQCEDHFHSDTALYRQRNVNASHGEKTAALLLCCDIC